jgi:Transposase DDE domain
VDRTRGTRGPLREIALEAYDRMVGLEPSELAVDSCITKAPCGGEKAGRNPVDRGKRGIKRSVVVDGKGIPLGSVSAPANRHDSPLLAPTLDAARSLGLVAQGASIRLDRGYDSDLTRERLLERGLVAEISKKGMPAPLKVTGRWIVERTNSWQNAHKKLVWCTERRDRVIDFWLALSEVIIIVRRLIREGWIRYRWEGRPRRRP